MKKILLIVLAFTALVACKKNEPEQSTDSQEQVTPVTPMDTTFVRKHLLEEYTGQDCGYCPYGMDSVLEFVNNHPNLVVVLHHAGYMPDHFTIAGSQTLVSAFQVSGAPYADIDRTPVYIPEEGEYQLIFHPAYLPGLDFTLENTTYASVDITSTYEAASRQLSVNVSGLIAKADAPALKLTVLVKESGMIDYQADFIETYNGWTEFRHVKAIRTFLTAPLGDDLAVTDNHYSVNLSASIDTKWVPENSTVVAYLTTEDNKVIQVEQAPVITGTQGGENLEHEGLKATPLPDNYPEPQDGKGPQEAFGMDTILMTTATAQPMTELVGSSRLWQLTALNASIIAKVNDTRCLPYASILVLTPATATELAEGTYPINLSLNANTVVASEVNERNGDISGSVMSAVSATLFKHDKISAITTWLMTDGELKITADGWILSTRTAANKPLILKGSTINYSEQ